MNRRRVVVTGLGIVSCFGNDVNRFYETLLSGKSGIGPVESFDVSTYATQIAAEIKNFSVEEKYMPTKMAKRMDPFIQYAMVAGKKALEDAFSSLENLSMLDLDKAGIIIGSGMGGMQKFSNGVITIEEKGVRRLTPFFVPSIITDMAGALLGIDLGFKGPNFSVSTACATSNYSIHLAAQEILSGRADLMVTGGTEAPMCPVGIGGFVASRALSTRNDEPQKASRPWDKNRDGFVVGEGSGVLVLESLEHAKKRGAKIYAELVGSAINTDAYHMTEPLEDGSVVAKCIEDAIANSTIDKDQINYINPHATSTVAGDLCEIRAIKKAFSKEQLSKMKMNGTKSLIGHCLGAAGGIEAIVTIKAIETKKLHPTLNLEDPEPEIEGIDPVKDKAQEHDVTGAISCSFGFGGHNSVLVFAPFKE